MRTERFEMQKVGLDYFENAPYLFRSTVVIRCTPQQLFASFEDADAWPAWAMPITHVEWTSPKPFGVGTTRSVSMLGNLIGHEEFLLWKPFTEMVDSGYGASGAGRIFYEDQQAISGMGLAVDA